MARNKNPAKPKRNQRRAKPKTREETARDRAINRAIAKAGDQTGPFIVRVGKADWKLTNQRPPDRPTIQKGKLAKQKPTKPSNEAMADALRAAGLAPAAKAAAEPKAKPEHKEAKPEKAASEPAPKTSPKLVKPKQKPVRKKPKTGKKKLTAVEKALAQEKGNEANRTKRERRFLGSLRKKASEMGGDITPVKLRWQQRQEEIAKLIADIQSASFAKLVVEWKKHVALAGYIDATGVNADRMDTYATLIASIEREWNRRSELTFSSEEYFDWPSTRAAKGKGGVGEINWATEGFLSYLGYHVGESSELNDRDRAAILKRVFKMSLPPLESPEYVRSWGAPGTPDRLKKMADSLASFARSAKRRSASNFATAIAEWEADLAMLHEEFYVAKFGFGWPSV